MKNLLTFLVTILVTFITSLLFDISFIKANYVRQFLVVVIIFFELLAGISVIRSNNSEK